jgi:hypothetical protein
MLATVALLIGATGVGVWRLAAGTGQTSPNVVQIAKLAFQAPTSPGPRPNPTDPTLLQEQFGGVTFPDYQRRFGVRASGQRTDVTGGRTVQTVYYRLGDNAPVSYSVVSGSSLIIPPSAREVTVAGVRIHSYTRGGLSFVTLVRHGRTCVLAGTVPTRTLVALAAAPLRPKFA